MSNVGRADPNADDAAAPFIYTGQDWSEIPRDVTRIHVDPSVKVISNSTFYDCQQLEEVVICEGLRGIGNSAFCSCKSLRSLKIPSTVRAIGANAFYGCVRLEEVELCDGLERIDKWAFYGCTSLKCTSIPSTVRVIQRGAFEECSHLAEVELCEGLQVIGWYAFSKCRSLKRIKVPSTAKVVSSGAFSACWQLMTVELGAEIEKIAKSAFQHCASLRNVVIPSPSQGLQCFDRGCHDLLRVFGSHENINAALTSRFDGLPLHKLCYYSSHYPVEFTLEQIQIVSGPQSESSLKLHSISESNQDCLGMTPLHILACSTGHELDLYQSIIANHPKSLITEDKWGCFPIFYSIWSNAPQKIMQYMIEIQKATFPSSNMNWNEMVRTLCRAGASPDVPLRLLRIQKAFFPEHSIDWQNIARELTISCLVRCREYNFRDFSSIWNAMMETLIASEAHQDLVQSLQVIEQSFFPNINATNWRRVCEGFVQPFDGWWHISAFAKTFHFLVKCSISERLCEIGVRKWRLSISSTVANLSSIYGWNLDLETHFDRIHFKMLSYEHLKDAMCLLELSLWKRKIDESRSMVDVDSNIGEELKGQCRVNCGADVIIPNILEFLV